MKVTDKIAEILKKNNIKNIFGLQGGAVVHIFDSLEKKKFSVTYNHHEQSAALAAVANAKVTNNIGCAVVTTGPGSTNAITGLLASWQDSVPCIFISGQARSNHVSYGKKVRQVGTQEVNICDIVKPITKYTKFIDDASKVEFEFNKAIKIAKSGRPGPVWLDVALEVQWDKIKKSKIKSVTKKIRDYNNISKFKKAFQLIKNASKPLFIIGYGVRSSKIKIENLIKFFDLNNLPYVLTWNSADIASTNAPNNLGIIGMSGQRGANKAIFESDLLICLGTHLSIPHTTTLYDSYALKAKKIIVNIDKDQLNNLNIKFDLKILDDVTNFANYLIKQKNLKKIKELHRNKKYNWYDFKSKKVNSNIFIRKLTSKIKSRKCVIVDGGGTALYAGFQSSILYKNDRIICSSAISSMGTGLAETIGVAKSNIFKELICVIGDGSFLMNCQDLQNIYQNKMNVIILVVNNNGYLAIRHTQKEFLNKNYFGTSPKGNLTFPSIKKIAYAFNIKYFKIDNTKNEEKTINQLLKHKGPKICELIVDEDQDSLFKQGYKKNSNGTFSPMTLEEMYPFVNKPISNTNN
ncbi:thiamine pyrophosphate-binding protein [Candidatus Pelagibacter sp.]|uniref:thiamine pyrophosphate-binding protein n=1 Tax=Candidatus Pelagibacter sp. TaxID=2024849 RepID=UPI003F87D224